MQDPTEYRLRDLERRIVALETAMERNRTDLVEIKIAIGKLGTKIAIGATVAVAIVTIALRSLFG